ncbi:hypothetical protein C7G83_04905 [Siccibacter turicensis]|uniref:Uncharacterized protein n=1 Tax=Siccibacter turicensis TaxID=357233 RepID=A0A2P8VMB8_9ENTR|nr:hypothetical protein C7G83_04905 [Siccibacter turicensis]
MRIASRLAQILKRKRIFSLVFRELVTVTHYFHTWLHFGAFLCFFRVARGGHSGHNQDPRGIDW